MTVDQRQSQASVAVLDAAIANCLRGGVKGATSGTGPCRNPVPLSQLCRTTGAVPVSVTGAGWLTTNGQVIRQGSAGSQVLSGCAAILMDQAAEDVDAFDTSTSGQCGYRP